MYARDGTLSSTSEPVAGLEHVLSWRPSGNLIAGTQRFGTKLGPGLGKGPEGKHDLVFFERNGLRHGEFGLRDVGGTGIGAGYNVKEIGWNADSTVLSVWVKRQEEGDIGELSTWGYTSNNVYFYKSHDQCNCGLQGTTTGKISASLFRMLEDDLIRLDCTYKVSEANRNCTTYSIQWSWAFHDRPVAP